MKQRIKVVLFSLLLVLNLTLGMTPKLYAANELTQLSVNKSVKGDSGNFAGDGDVDVGGEIETNSATDGSSAATSSTTQIGGKVTDVTGKNIKTGDILATTKTFAILFLGVGCIILIMKRKKNQDSVKE